MSNQGWSFPAPPPPPPVATMNPPPPPQGYQTTTGYGHRGGRGNSGPHRGRGRGRGDSSRGGQYTAASGRQYPFSNESHFPPIPAQSGYASQPQSVTANGYQPQGYGAQYSSQSSQYPPQQTSQPYYQQPTTYAQPSSQPYPQAPYDRGFPQNHDPYSSHQKAYTTQVPQPSQVSQYTTPSPAVQASPSYASMPPNQSAPNRPHSPYNGHVQPQLMGPPIRWGFDSHGSTNRQRPDLQSSARHNSDQRRDSRSSHPSRDSRPNQNLSHSSRGGSSNRSHPKDGDHFRGQKRRHEDAFDRKDNYQPRSQLSPPVPYFGNPLPSKPPPPEDGPQLEGKSGKKSRNRSKKLKLGLTPKGEDRESSGEDDADEETRLASKLDASGQKYEFSYKGNMSTLSNPSEIADWIKERKTRYPTLAKVAEAKTREKERQNAIAEAKKARDDALKTKRLEREEVRAKRAQEQLEETRLKAEQDEAEDAALKAKIRAEKLRRKLQKERNRLANAEAEAERTRIKAEELKSASVPQRTSSTDQHQNSAEHEPSIKTEVPSSFADSSSDALTSFAPLKLSSGEASLMKPYLSPPEDSQPQSPSALSRSSSSSLSISESSSDPNSLVDEATSSSGSEDSAPEEKSSKRRAGNPECDASGANRSRKTKNAKTAPCTFFLKNGSCKKGRSCRFSHDVQQESHQSLGSGGTVHEQGRRKGLYQVMVEKEMVERDAHVLSAITHLGDRGALDEPESKAESEPNDVPAREIPHAATAMDGVAGGDVSPPHDLGSAIEAGAMHGIEGSQV